MRISDWSSDVCSSDLFEISAVVRPALIDDERPFYGLAGRGALQLLRVIAEAVAQIGFKAAAARMVLCVVPGPFPYRDTSRSTFVAFVILDRIHSVSKAGRQQRDRKSTRLNSSN